MSTTENPEQAPANTPDDRPLCVRVVSATAAQCVGLSGSDELEVFAARLTGMGYSPRPPTAAEKQAYGCDWVYVKDPEPGTPARPQ
jgi:hypothetical protein